MKFPHAILFLLVLSGLVVTTSRADSTKTITVSASSISDNDVAVISQASHYSQLSVADVTVHDLAIAFTIYSEAYKGGKSTRFIYQPGGQRWYPAAKDVTAKICLSLEMNEPPKLGPTNLPSGEPSTAPGTGSMRLGAAFRLISGVPQNDSSSSFIVRNADFDLHQSRLVRCVDLPFTIVNGDTRRGAVPVIAIFPTNFNTQSLSGNVDSAHLPDNSVVLYAASTIVASDEDAWKTTLHTDLTNGAAYGIAACTIGHTFFSEPAEVTKVLESHTTNELFPVFAEFRKEPPQWKAAEVDCWSNIVVKGLRGKPYVQNGGLRWSSNNDIISAVTTPMCSYHEEWNLPHLSSTSPQNPR